MGEIGRGKVVLGLRDADEGKEIKSDLKNEKYEIESGGTSIILHRGVSWEYYST